MAFSQSFEFGDSTFNQLANQEKCALETNGCDEKPTDNANGGLEIIQESPPARQTKTSKLNSFNLISFHANSNNSTSKSIRQRFRRSKSDSKLPCKTATDSSVSTSKNVKNNFSEFFRSDITFSVGDENVAATPGASDSVLRVSQIEAAFHTEQQKTESEQLEVSVSILDGAIFSDDVRKLLEADDEKEQAWPHQSMQATDGLSTSCNIQNDQKIPHCDEEVALMDESSFICSAMLDSRAAIHLAKDLQSSRSVARGERVNSPTDAFFEDIQSTPRPAEIKPSPSLRKEYSQPTQLKPPPPKRVPQEERKDSTRASFKPPDKEALKSLSSWGLPRSILLEYEKKGVRQMFDWQVECLSNAKVLFEHCNLVYSAPTSAGKTLVSEILLLKTVLERSKKVLMILPFISVVREKMFYLQDLLTPSGYRVEGFFGGYTPPGGFESIHVAICTIEKANSIVNKLLEQGKLEEIGTIVVDEVHLISDPGRGYILELLLAKILYMSRKYGYQIQVIAMSATLANVELLQRWLQAELFITDFRPVALQEMIKVGTKIYDNRLRFLRDVTHVLTGEKEAFPALPNDSDHCAQLCMETLLHGCSAIVFCPSKDWCETLAMQLAAATHALVKGGTAWGSRLRAQFNKEAIDEVKKQLRDIPTGLDTVLEKTITCGCAFHHAGLTTEERDIVEASFKSGALKIIVATSTLSSGVNLPARRVLIRSPLFAGKPMSSLTYKQMIGRAGRTGKDTVGESILICTEANSRAGRELIGADLRPIASCLEMDKSTHLKRALLEVISSSVASSKADIQLFVECTLLSAQKSLEAVNVESENESVSDGTSYIKNSLDFLVEYEFIRLQVNAETAEEFYVATRLGMACLASSMPPTDGLILFSELQKSRRCFVLESELHAVYLVTPYSVCHQMQNMDWLFFLDLWEKLPPAMKKVGELVGVKESFLVRAMRGQTNLDYKLLQIHKRFYTALALQELVNETPINAVASKYKCTRGLLQTLQQMASTFAGIVTSFCNSLQWCTLSLVVAQFKERLFFGVHRDLIELLRLPDLSHKRARVLFDAGITNPAELANADVLTLERVLHNALSFDSDKQREHENAHEADQRKMARICFMTGGKAVTVLDAAKLLVLEARQYVQLELGVENINWTPLQPSSVGDGDRSELHMSCEDMGIKRKSNEGNGIVLKNVMTPPKQSKVEVSLVKRKVPESTTTTVSQKDEKVSKELNGKHESIKKHTQITARGEGTSPRQSCIQNKENIWKTLPTSKTNGALTSLKKQPPTKRTPERLRTLPLSKKTPPVKQHPQQPPRRSPRNHMASTAIQPPAPSNPKASIAAAGATLNRRKVEPELEALFNDDSFEMNSGLANALVVKTTPPKKNQDEPNFKKPLPSPIVAEKNSEGVGKPPDEIPNSQEFNDLESDSYAVTPKHQSRLLRCSRIQRHRHTPELLRVKPKLEVPTPPPKKPAAATALAKDGVSSSSTIELSDLSLEQSLLQNPLQLNASHILSCSKTDTDASSFKFIDVIDIAGHKELFQRASENLLAAKRIGFCVGLQQLDRKRTPLIGGNLLLNQVGFGERADPATEGHHPAYLFLLNDSTYLAGVAFCLGQNVSYHLNMQDGEGSYAGLTSAMKCKLIASLLHSSEHTLLCFDAKEQLKMLRGALPQLGEINASLEDPKVANWLLQPDKSMTLQQMTQQFAPECGGLVKLCGSGRGYNSFGLEAGSGILAKMRCSIEACVTVHVLVGQNENLERIGSGQLKKFFTELEMPLQLSLANMEVYGFPASEAALQRLFQQMVDTMKKVEARIYELHGGRFNLGSTQAVARVVGLHRKPHGRVSTSRQILDRIDTPIAQLIVTYRKLSVTLTKNIQPLLKCVREDRIHGHSITNTATGRIAMMEPNLQNVAKDFEVDLGGDKKLTISCRSAFRPTAAKRCLVAADFCQLEMRILAHLSQDAALLQVMGSNKDLFTAIAARWNRIDVESVSEQVRNGTKQICYAIVYGMGMRSLAESLKCSEQEALLISEQFHAAYPGIRSYAEKVIKYARNNGYIETITGRRRYLEHVNSEEPLQRKQAERQAVNSSIQGSAADIAKTAIHRMEKNISKYRHKLGLREADAVRFVLHLHDELFFEVAEEKAKKIGKLLSVTMENCVRLSVPLKVKLKIGRSWGELKDVQL